MKVELFCYQFQEIHVCFHFTLPKINRRGLNTCMKKAPAAHLASGWWALRKEGGRRNEHSRDARPTRLLALPALLVPPKPDSCLHATQPTKALASLHSQLFWGNGVCVKQGAHRLWCRSAVGSRNRQGMATDG